MWVTITDYFDWSHVSIEFKYIHTRVIIKFSCL